MIRVRFSYFVVTVFSTLFLDAQQQFYFTNFASLGSAYSVARDTSGNSYSSDYAHNGIQQITAAGVVSALPSANPSLNHPDGLVTDAQGSLYIAEQDNNAIRRYSNGVYTVFAGTPGTSTLGTNDGVGATAKFYKPAGMSFDAGGNLYVADRYNHLIRRITPAGVVTTIAGLGKSGGGGYPGTNDGVGSTARFNFPSYVLVDPATNVIVADTQNHTIRRMTFNGSGWEVTTIAGLGGVSGTNDGPSLEARFNVPRGLAFDSAGNLFVADSNNHTLRRISKDGIVTTVAGKAGEAGSSWGTNEVARFSGPRGLAFDDAGNLYVADTGNSRLQKGVLLSSFASEPPSFSVPSVNGGTFYVSLTNTSPGSDVILEVSSNLTAWFPVWTNASAVIDYSEPVSEAVRFYRAHLIP